MGRFDALSNLEETQVKKTPPPVVVSPAPKQPQSLPPIKQAAIVKKPTNPQVHKTTKKSPFVDSIEKIEKYTTHLEPSIVKKIKRYALDQDIKDYQVIKEALLLFFEKNK
jgi:hypothetical protein